MKIHTFMEFSFGRYPCTQKEKTLFFDARDPKHHWENLVQGWSTTVRQWSCNSSKEAENTRFVSWELFGFDGCFLSRKNHDFFIVGLFFFSPQKNGIFPGHAQIFLGHLFPWFLPLKTVSEHLLLETPLTSTPSTLGETANEFSFPNTHKSIPIMNFFFCLKLELTVHWPFFNLCLGLYYSLNTDSISPAMPIQSEYTWAKRGTWTNLRT